MKCSLFPSFSLSLAEIKRDMTTLWRHHHRTNHRQTDEWDGMADCWESNRTRRRMFDWWCYIGQFPIRTNYCLSVFRRNYCKTKFIHVYENRPQFRLFPNHIQYVHSADHNHRNYTAAAEWDRGRPGEPQLLWSADDGSRYSEQFSRYKAKVVVCGNMPAKKQTIRKKLSTNLGLEFYDFAYNFSSLYMCGSVSMGEFIVWVVERRLILLQY